MQSELNSMISNINWTQANIQQVNNYLIIMGDQLLKSGHGIESVYKACYALPSNPSEMDAWCDEWLNEESKNTCLALLKNKQL